MENEAVQEAPETEVTEQTNEREKPAGYDPVDLSTLPEEIAKPLNDRIDYLYSQVKTNERALREYRSLSAEQAQAIEDLMSGVGQVVDHLENKTMIESEANIEKSMREAFEGGDLDKFFKEQKKLIEIQTKKLIPAKENIQKNISKQATDTSNYISPEDDRLVEAWQSETDERGQPLRPWARTENPEDPDPDFVKAYIITKRVAAQNPGKSMNQILAEVDKQMGVKTASLNGSQNVMGGNLKTQSKNRTIRLTPKQQEIAVRTKFGGSKAKSDAEHIEAYRKQIEKIQSQKGARQ